MGDEIFLTQRVIGEENITMDFILMLIVNFSFIPSEHLTFRELT